MRFGSNMYYWRRLSDEDRERILAMRKGQKRPWHSLPHRSGPGRFLLSAACYEHRPVIGVSPERMLDFEQTLLTALDECETEVIAWTVLPKHYHVLISTGDVANVTDNLGKLHGRLSYAWNNDEGKRGRKVWFGVSDREMRSDRHFHSSLNYVHHNPVKHGYVSKWQDWSFSSASAYLESVTSEEAERHWREYDISDMGSGWDP